MTVTRGAQTCVCLCMWRGECLCGWMSEWRGVCREMRVTATKKKKTEIVDRGNQSPAGLRRAELLRISWG